MGIQMLLKSEKSHKIDRREMYMLHRLDVQRVSGKKATRQTKTFDGNVTMTEVGCLITHAFVELNSLSFGFSASAGQQFHSFRDDSTQGPMGCPGV